MTKTVLDVGNCGPDHHAITRFLTNQFDAVKVLQADDAKAALDYLRTEKIDLVLVNRKLDVDYSDGVDVIRSIRSDSSFASIPIMLITNYDNYQEEAIAAGAIRGFGKLQFSEPSTIERLRSILG
jgi:DNA-binding response OmpR family regulator